ncbi:MAG: aminotransferase class V-fold PLP-dependent enzyme [Pseudomonadota bacterium]
MALTDQDITRLRADTAGCEARIHFNNAGASPVPNPVHAAVTAHLERECQVGGYRAEAEAAEALGRFYSNFATLLNASADEIAYVENATRAWDMVFYGLKLVPGDRVLTHGAEYVSNYLGMLQVAQTRGIHIDIIPSDAHGQLDVGAMDALVTPQTRCVAITHVPTQGGLVNPAEAVGRVARRHKLFYLLDACQSAGQIALDVEAIGCDALSGTGRKFLRGPRGTGFLYVRRSALDRIDPPFVDLRAAHWESDAHYRLADGARRFENWESYVAGKIGLAEAVHYALDLGVDAIAQRVQHLAGTLRRSLSDLPGVAVHDQGETRCGIVTFDKHGTSPDSIANALEAQSMAVSVSTLSSARLDLGVRGLENLVRASVHCFNTEAEISRFCDAVAAL